MGQSRPSQHQCGGGRRAGPDVGNNVQTTHCINGLSWHHLALPYAPLHMSWPYIASEHTTGMFAHSHQAPMAAYLHLVCLQEQHQPASQSLGEQKRGRYLHVPHSSR